MVLTRSADKRQETNRDEDLVLRSRKISSPNSTISTPSQSRKRQVTTRENDESPRMKRSRIGTDEMKRDGAFHVVVNIPIKSDAEQGSSDQIPEQATDPGTDSAASTRIDTPDKDLSDRLTPKGKVIAISEPSHPDNDIFKTPATSRHKRFDSEEPDEDTIVVGTNFDSSAPQGYQTAEEEISGSDDDSAPEIETTKARKAQHLTKSLRTPRKRQPKGKPIPRPQDEHEETIEMAALRADGSVESADAATQFSTGRADHNHVVNEPNEVEDEHLIVDFDDSLTIQQSRTPDASNPRISKNVTEDRNSVLSADVNEATLNARQDLSSPIRHLSITRPPIGVSGVAHAVSFSREFGHRERLDKHQKHVTGSVNPIRLPDKSTSTLTGYRRNLLQQKVARSGGGFRTESNWSKKRTAFVSH